MTGYDWISFTTDYGRADGFVASCHGVIARIAPHARVLDVTHEVPAGDIRRGAVVLADTVGYLPPAVHLAVVDPGVGTERRGLAVVAPGGVLVGPDNGLLLAAADALGGVREVFELAEPAYRLGEVSATFHGRDVFAPAAAHLAHGVRPAELGPALSPDGLVRLPTPVCAVKPGRLEAEVLTVDHFGNVALAAGRDALRGSGLRHGETVALRWADGVAAALLASTFGDVPPGELVVLVDSAGRVALACHGGSAADRLGLRPGVVMQVSQLHG